MQVHDYAQVQPTFIRRYVGDVGRPYPVPITRLKVAVQDIGRDRVIVFRIRRVPIPSTEDALDVITMHNARNSVEAASDASGTEIGVDTRAAVGLAALLMDGLDLNQ